MTPGKDREQGRCAELSKPCYPNRLHQHCHKEEQQNNQPAGPQCSLRILLLFTRLVLCALSILPHIVIARQCLSSGRVATEVPRPNIRQLSVWIQESSVGPDIGHDTTEGAEPGISLDASLAVEIGYGLVVELLCVDEGFVGEAEFGDPDVNAWEAVVVRKLAIR